MEKKNKLALYIGYFLARFNEDAYTILNFGTQNITHNKIGEILNVNPHTIKNMRDQFDPLFGFRAGWYQRPLSPSRLQVVEMFESFNFNQVYTIVNDILSSFGESINAEEISSIVMEDKDIYEGIDRTFTSRGITGSKAERFFRSHFMQILPEFKGELIDTTLDGVGYDFKNSLETIYVEVKGSISNQKNILLTDKEWEAAKKFGDCYYLVLIYLINDIPNFILVNNPADCLSPNLFIQKTITMNWNVPHVQMQKLANDSNKLIID